MKKGIHDNTKANAEWLHSEHVKFLNILTGIDCAVNTNNITFCIIIIFKQMISTCFDLLKFTNVKTNIFISIYLGKTFTGKNINKKTRKNFSNRPNKAYYFIINISFMTNGKRIHVFSLRYKRKTRWSDATWGVFLTLSVLIKNALHLLRVLKVSDVLCIRWRFSCSVSFKMGNHHWFPQTVTQLWPSDRAEV